MTLTATAILVGMRLLVIGDSMSHGGTDNAPNQVDVSADTGRTDAPGNLMASWIMSTGLVDAARVDAKIGRSAHSLFHSEQGDALLAADRAWRPDLVIVMLGTNDLGLNMAVDAGDMARIRDSFPGVEVWGIGPPDFADPTLHGQTAAVVNMMASVFAPRFIDARPLTKDLLTSSARDSKGIHFWGQGARLFGYRLAAAFVAHRRTRWLVPLVALGPWGELAYAGAVALAARSAGTPPA